MSWRMRLVASLVLALVVTLVPPVPLRQATACPPDGRVDPGLAYAAPPLPLRPPAFVADLASKNPRTFGRHVGHAYVGDPVDVVSGAYSTESGSELRVPSHGLDFIFSRTYNSADDFQPSPMGPGWVHSYDWEYFESTGEPVGGGTLRRGDGRRGVQPDDISWIHNADNTFTLVTHDHTTYIFGSSYYRGTNCFDGFDLFTWVLTTIKSAAGDQMNLTWSGLVPVGTGPGTSGGMAKVLLSVADTQGRAYAFGYDARYDLASVTDPFGRALSFSHNASDQLISATDLGGHTTSYAYDGATRHITTLTDPDGRVRPTNTYAGNGTVSRQADGLGYATTFTINPYVSATVTDPRGTTTTYTENSCGWLTKQTVTGGNTYVWRQGFNAGCDRTQTVDPLGNTTDFAYDASHNVLTRTDPPVAGGRPTTSYQYDGKKNVTRLTDPRGFTTDRTYDATTSAPLSERRQIDATTYATTSYGYGDATNKLHPTTVTSPLGNLISLSYDANGNLTRVQDADGVAATFGYDAFGRRTSATDAEGHTTTTAYGAGSQVTSVTDPLGHAARYTYDGAGNTATVTNRNGNPTEYSYDQNYHVTNIRQHPDTGTTYTTTLALDGNGNVTRLTEGNGNVRDFGYNGLNALVSATEDTSQGTLITTFGRDANGNKVSRTTPDSVTVNYGYDGMNRLTSVTATGVSITYGYDLTSELTSMIDSVGITTYSYDGGGRPIAVNGPVNSLTYSFDLEGNRTRIGYPFGDVRYTFTPGGRLSTVTDWTSRVTRYAYSPTGRESSVAYPNGMTATLSYDAAGRLIQLTNLVGATTMTSHQYSLDSEGNRASLVEFVSGITTGASDSFIYTFDGLDRLRTVSGSVAETFSHDGASNITARTGPSATYAYDGADRVQSDGSHTFSWSIADRLVIRGSDTFAYDQVDRLTGAAISGSSATYSYFGDGLLATRNGTPYLWDRSRSIAPVVQVGSDAVVYGSRPLYVIHSDGATTTFALDGVGSVRAELSASGAVTASQRFSVYGAVAQTSGTKSTPLGFAGELADPNGMIYLRARWYDPASQRFLTSDPIIPLAPGIASYNPCGYVAGRPTALVDPTGACPGGSPKADSELDDGSCIGGGGGAPSSGLGSATQQFEEITIGGVRMNPRVLGQLVDPRSLGPLAGMTAAQLNELLNNPSAQKFEDTATGNVNIVQEVQGLLVRITVAADDLTKVISVGLMRARQLENGISNGRYVPLP